MSEAKVDVAVLREASKLFDNLPSGYYGDAFLRWEGVRFEMNYKGFQVCYLFAWEDMAASVDALTRMRNCIASMQFDLRRTYLRAAPVSGQANLDKAVEESNLAN